MSRGPFTSYDDAVEAVRVFGPDGCLVWTPDGWMVRQARSYPTRCWKCGRSTFNWAGTCDSHHADMPPKPNKLGEAS